MQKKNLCGRDVNEKFIIFFNADQIIAAIKLFICECVLFLEEDLFTAAEVLNTCDENLYDVYHLKLKSLTGKLTATDVDWVFSVDDPKVPVILTQFKSFNPHRSSGLKCQCLINLRLIDQAQMVLSTMTEENAEKLKLAGIIYFFTKAQKDAQKSLLKSAKLCGTDWETFYYLGKLYLSIDDEVRGVKCLRKSCSIKKTVKNIELVCQYLSADETLVLLDDKLHNVIHKPFFQFRIGLSYMELGRYHEAVRIFQKLSRNSENVMHLECLAEAYAYCGSISTAVRTLLKSLENANQSSTVNPRYRSAQLLQEAQEYSSAKEILEDLAKSGEFAPAIIGLAECHLMEARHFADEWLPQLSIRHIEHALRLCSQSFDLGYGDSPLVWKIAADVLSICEDFDLPSLQLSVPAIFSQSNVSTLSRNDAIKLSVACYSKVVNLVPENPLAWSDVSLAYHRCDRDLEAIFCGKKAIELTGDAKYNDSLPELWNNLGIVSMKTDAALAQHSFIQAVTLNKELSNAWSNLGLLYLKEGNLNLSNQAYSKAQAGDPDNSTPWAGQAHVAEKLDHPDRTDLFRHSAELINKSAANGHSYHIARNIGQYTNSNKGNILAALTNIQRLQNIMTLDEQQREIIAVLAEELRLHQTAVDMWKSFPDDNNIMQLNAARVLAKQNNVDEALSILSKFDDCQDGHEQKMIGYILTLLDQHGLAVQYFTNAFQKDPTDYAVSYANGVAAIKAGEFDQGKVLLFDAIQNGAYKLKLKAIGALGAFAYLSEDSELMLAVLLQAEKLPDNQESNFLLTDLKVRLAVIEGNVKCAIGLCAKAIHINPSLTFYRTLLGKLLLKFDPSSPTLPALIIPHLDDSLELHPLSQLAANGKQMSEQCFKSSMSARHKQPWNMNIKTSFVTSIDHRISSLSMKLPNEEINTTEIERLKIIQGKYLNDIIEGDDDENIKLKVWALCGLMRLSNSATSDISKYCFSMLENLDEELHLRVIATLATIANKKDKLSIGKYACLVFFINIRLFRIIH